MKVLVTGAAGSIGRTLVRGLPAAGHELRGLDLVAADTDGCALGWVTGDCLDPAVASEAVRGVDAVVHLAGNPDEDSLPASLESHVHATARLLDAMVEHGVGRIVYASSNHAVGQTPRSELLTTHVPPRPDTFYGVAKVAAEALLSLYADRHGIAATALRIGTFEERPSTVRALSTWLSPDDAVRLADAAARRTSGGLEVVYGVSANTRGWWDLRPGRALGYDPQDDAETYADLVAPRPEDDDDAAHVGGPFVTDPPRPAF
ncbi:NAD-dependent epimerase/dehydratase family protein [Aeromicrobium chenweiae]|uniref:NAD(P)-dependent oxidoreductase n=1 Tax=Aeromicrobium chenweiae TaxID=2079793 RepID=A0A2S0WPQ3_9ACTN|nr:NAD-dependent epimerase/dehydratase family protein [Aeromicrobium chenweiae]AWB93224.1 NAD(P)-dependent oxidoreductase [Aeromicrobium chenweiae]TGN34216.1 NAD-dependent epimerase/dehydratase family protein [Aeromicrobium chenweiae]